MQFIQRPSKAAAADSPHAGAHAIAQTISMKLREQSSQIWAWSSPRAAAPKPADMTIAHFSGTRNLSCELDSASTSICARK
jgi:hypothetical protein